LRLRLGVTVGFGLISIEIDIEVGKVVVVNDETERAVEV
jgi:hypothetical protein